MTDTPLTPPRDETPIDAEFEPADSKRDDQPKGSGGPGWLAFGVLGCISLLSLALAGLSLGLIPGFKPGAKTIAALEAQLEQATSAQTAIDANSQTLSSELSTLKTRADGLQADRTRTRVEIQEIKDLVEKLEDRLLAARVPVASSTSSDEAATTNGLDEEALSGLETRLAVLEIAFDDIQAPRTGDEAGEAAPMARPALIEINTELADLRARIGTLEAAAEAEAAAPEPESDQIAEAALALSAIEAAARRGRPFLAAQQRLSVALPNTGAANNLSELATKAIPTIAALREQFPDLMETALDVDANADTNESGWMRNIFGDGITVRRKDEVGTRDHLNRAMAALQSNELRETVEHIQALAPDVQAVFTGWVDNAEDRARLEETLEALRLTMIAKDRP